jgi:outer membrane protein
MNNPCLVQKPAACCALVCLLAWLSIPSLRAASPGQTNGLPPRPITMQECFGLALTNNLDLQIDRINPTLAQYDVEIARAGYDPVLKFSGTHNYQVAGASISQSGVVSLANQTDSDNLSSSLTGIGPMGLNYSMTSQANQNYGSLPDSAGGAIGISLAQPLLKNFLIDSTRYNIAVARKNLKVSEVGLEGQIIQVITGVEQAYYELIFARENVKVQQEAVGLAERLYRDNHLKNQIGTMTRLDEAQAEAQVAARQSDLSVALQALATAQNALKRLITANYTGLHDTSLNPTETLMAVPQKFEVQESWRTGLIRRPDLRQARLAVERQDITVKYYKNQMLPELDLVGSYGNGASGGYTRNFADVLNDFTDGSKPFWSGGASLTIPLSNKAARERYRQGRATVTQLLLTLKNLEQGALVEIDEAVNQINSSLNRVKSTRQARLYSEEALNDEQKKLDSGKSTSFVVLQLQRDLTSARSDEIRALADYNKALAALYAAEGTTLERKKINVEVK